MRLYLKPLKTQTSCCACTALFDTDNCLIIYLTVSFKNVPVLSRLGSDGHSENPDVATATANFTMAVTRSRRELHRCHLDGGTDATSASARMCRWTRLLSGRSITSSVPKETCTCDGKIHCRKSVGLRGEFARRRMTNFRCTSCQDPVQQCAKVKTMWFYRCPRTVLLIFRDHT